MTADDPSQELARSASKLTVVEPFFFLVAKARTKAWEIFDDDVHCLAELGKCMVCHQI